MLPVGGFPLSGYLVFILLKRWKTSQESLCQQTAEIASIAGAAGAEIISRPDELASDTASEWLAWQHTIHWVKAKY